MKLRKMIKVIGGLAASLAVVFAISGCAPDSIGTSASSQESGSRNTVSVGTLKGQPHLYQPYFYQKFLKGTTVKVVTFDSSPDIANAIASGAIDYGVLGMPAVVSSVSQGQKLSVIASAADGGSGFVARKGIDNISQLKGKKVGYPQGSSQEILLKLTLSKYNIKQSDVQLVNLPFADMATALSSGRIDAFLSAENGPATAIVAGAHSLVSPYDTPIGKVNIVLATKQSTVKQKTDLTKDVVEAHKQAVEYMADNHDAWASGLVKQFGLDQAVADQAIKNVTPRYKLDSDYLTEAKALISQMKSIGQINTAPSTSSFIDTQFVSE